MIPNKKSGARFKIAARYLQSSNNNLINANRNQEILTRSLRSYTHSDKSLSSEQKRSVSSSVKKAWEEEPIPVKTKQSNDTLVETAVVCFADSVKANYSLPFRKEELSYSTSSDEDNGEIIFDTASVDLQKVHKSRSLNLKSPSVPLSTFDWTSHESKNRFIKKPISNLKLLNDVSHFDSAIINSEIVNENIDIKGDPDVGILGLNSNLKNFRNNKEMPNFNSNINNTKKRNHSKQARKVPNSNNANKGNKWKTTVDSKMGDLLHVRQTSFQLSMSTIPSLKSTRSEHEIFLDVPELKIGLKDRFIKNVLKVIVMNKKKSKFQSLAMFVSRSGQKKLLRHSLNGKRNSRISVIKNPKIEPIKPPQPFKQRRRPLTLDIKYDAQHILTQTLKNLMSGLTYDCVIKLNMPTVLVNRIVKRLKLLLKIPQCRYVVHVTVLQPKNQAIDLGCRVLQNINTDYDFSEKFKHKDCLSIVSMFFMEKEIYIDDSN